MNKAYYWYRPHPYLDNFYSGKILNPIVDTTIFSKYFSDPIKIELIEKYFPNGLNPHGLSMFLSRNLVNPEVNEPITDIIFELVRQLHFPEAPSRLSSLYASESIQQAFIWKSFLQTGEQSVIDLWEIEFQTNAQLYDASFLGIGSKNDFSFLTAMDNAHKYWNGGRSQKPLLELLIPYPATVTRKISNSDLMSIDIPC